MVIPLAQRELALEVLSKPCAQSKNEKKDVSMGALSKQREESVNESVAVMMEEFLGRLVAELAVLLEQKD